MENNEASLEAFAAGLEMYGLDAITARNAREALAGFQAHEGRLLGVLIDHALPGGGAHLAEELRRAGYKGRIIVMFVQMEPKELAAYEKGAVSGFFGKPFGLSMLLAMLGICPPGPDAG